MRIKVALVHPAANNGICSRHRSKFKTSEKSENSVNSGEETDESENVTGIDT
ncbi:hypothetical protein [Methanosarcina siciliae]|uniref:hypothetical protein n=1 Tax=Methanosarcina siciliae TaxID=38027 RepID=UPI0012E09523|nr:hypothetical protein [Methanosarcina siciliae]